MHGDGKGGDRSGDRPHAETCLADIVEQGGGGGIRVGGGGGDPAHHRVGVALVAVVLRPEQPETLAIERGGRLAQLGRSERLGEGDLEEAAAEVGQPAQRAGYWDRLALHSTQKREVGRNSMRSAPIVVPQLSQVP